MYVLIVLIVLLHMSNKCISIMIMYIFDLWRKIIIIITEKIMWIIFVHENIENMTAWSIYLRSRKIQ